MNVSQQKDSKFSAPRDQMNVVIVGHVDHGKSTLVGRLLADTGSLPSGKLEAVKANCARNAKPFEYAFLLDALKDEQSQGITIDTARCFFKSRLRDYIIIDAPGHIEFLKNMVSGAARAEAAVLVIDAHEGIQENSRRHGYMMSFLGVRNITVAVNKMDLVGYSQETFERIRAEFLAFLAEINMTPTQVIPISGREGDNIITRSERMPWYSGPAILEALDAFHKAAPKADQPFRMPVQDIYKFTQEGDDRRIVAGRIETGTVQVGDEVVFLPSNKKSRIVSVEGFNSPVRQSARAGQSTGFCLETQIYIRPGDIMCKAAEPSAHVSTRFKANIFWMGHPPLIKGKTYKLKLATQQVPVTLAEVVSVLDASELSSVRNKSEVNRHDVAECVFEALKPVAFDIVLQIPETGRFVLVDNYEISGGGIILEPIFEQRSMIADHIRRRELLWERSEITPAKRAMKYQHKSVLVMIAGDVDTGKLRMAKALEEALFSQGRFVYFLGVSNRTGVPDMEAGDRVIHRLQQLYHLGELAHILTDAGLVLIAAVSGIDEHDLDLIRRLNRPCPTVVVNVGINRFSSGQADLEIPANENPAAAAGRMLEVLESHLALDPEYFI